MNCIEALDKISDLRHLKKIYSRMKSDEYSILYGNSELTFMILKVDSEIERIIDLLNSMELDDSYDQNTGEVNNVYKFERKEC